MSVSKPVNIVVPSSPADLADLFKVFKQISDSKTRAKGESDYQKEAIAALAEKYGIEKKYINQAVNDFHKDQFDHRAEEFDQYSNLYEAIMSKGKAAAANPSATAAVDVSDLDEEE